MFRSAIKVACSNAYRASSTTKLNVNLTRHLCLANNSSQILQSHNSLSPQFRRNFSDDALEKSFQTAVANLQKVNEVENDVKLKLYALYKQATNGPCNVDKPSVFDVVAKAKYQAWKGLGEMNEEDARKNYISTVEELLSKSGQTSKESGAEEPPLVFEEKDHVYWIRLNRPKAYNALNEEMYEGIIEALKRAAEDPDIKFVAIKGTGKYFSSGNDLSKFSCTFNAFFTGSFFF